MKILQLDEHRRDVIVVELTHADAEYISEIFAENVDRATAANLKADTFDLDIINGLGEIISERKKSIHRARLNDQIAELERERDSI